MTETTPTTTRFGLPAEVRFCRRCVISNQRPSSTVEFDNRPESAKRTIAFDADGVCDACRYAEYKDTKVDWVERERELRDLLDRHRRDDGAYDIIVPGSGGKDSIYASHVLKYRYRMHPLTVTWAPHIYTEVGWRNFQNWLASGFDNYLATPNGKVHRLLTRLAFEKLFHPFQPFIFGQKTIGPRMAQRHGVKLVMYGENEAEYGNPLADNLRPTRDDAYFVKDELDLDAIHLGGVSASELIGAHGLDRSDLEMYLPATRAETERWGGAVHYLGYYLKWTPQECYYFAVDNAGFDANPERTEGTYSKYNSLDDRVDGFHYWTTFLKFGIGRATYDACQEIRNHHITREEGVGLVRRFDGEFPKRYFAEFLRYVDLSEERYWEIAESFRPAHLWERTADGWKLRHQIS